MTLRAAVIGCGKIGSEFADDARTAGVHTHAGAYAAVPGVELAGVCDADEGRSARCAERWALSRSFTDVVDLLETVRPDLVSVCTPDETHGTILRRVLMAPGVRGILAEKPLALDVEEARQIVRLARDRGVVLAVNYSRRYSRVHAEVRERIAAGAIGTVQKLTGLYTKGVLHNGTHWFDLARWMVGEITAVHGVPNADGVRSDPTLDVRLEFEGGATGVLLGCAAEAFTVFEMDIVGTAGRVRLVDAGHRIELQTVGDSRHYRGYRSLLTGVDLEGGMRDLLANAVQDLVACVVRGASTPRCTGSDGVAALSIGAAAIASAASGERVVVKYETALV